MFQYNSLKLSTATDGRFLSFETDCNFVYVYYRSSNRASSKSLSILVPLTTAFVVCLPLTIIPLEQEKHTRSIRGHLSVGYIPGSVGNRTTSCSSELTRT